MSVKEFTDVNCTGAVPDQSEGPVYLFAGERLAVNCDVSGFPNFENPTCQQHTSSTLNHFSHFRSTEIDQYNCSAFPTHHMAMAQTDFSQSLPLHPPPPPPPPPPLPPPPSATRSDNNFYADITNHSGLSNLAYASENPSLQGQQCGLWPTPSTSLSTELDSSPCKFGRPKSRSGFDGEWF
ncbi:hypothetical protein Aperf_G00000054732 [Anoplocephala perfoliata]